VRLWFGISLGVVLLVLLSKESEHRARLSSKIAGLIALILVTFSLAGCGPAVPSPPIPKGYVGIHVEFADLSTADWNELTAFVKKLAEEHSAYLKGSDSERDVGDHNSFHGLGSDGFVDQIYNPDHQAPSPEVEEAMRTRLETFLQGKKINPSRVKLELRYGQ
jgi:hypothetical protein